MSVLIHESSQVLDQIWISRHQYLGPHLAGGGERDEFLAALLSVTIVLEVPKVKASVRCIAGYQRRQVGGCAFQTRQIAGARFL